MRGIVGMKVYALMLGGIAASAAVIYWWIDAMGLLLGMFTATLVVLLVLGDDHREQVATVQGYHAGYHAGADIECFGPDCELLAMTRERMAQLTEVASAGVGFDPYLSRSR